jgi:hypothetical protein
MKKWRQIHIEATGVGESSRILAPDGDKRSLATRARIGSMQRLAA